MMSPGRTGLKKKWVMPPGVPLKTTVPKELMNRRTKGVNTEWL